MGEYIVHWSRGPHAIEIDSERGLQAGGVHLGKEPEAIDQQK